MGGRTKLRKIKLTTLFYTCQATVYILEKLVSLFENEKFISQTDSRVALARNYKYELYGKIIHHVFNGVRLPHILSIEDTLDDIIKHKKSVCRFGDGEFEALLGRESNFHQHPSSALSEKLKTVLTSNHPHILVCIYDFFGSLQKYNPYHRAIAREHMASFREKIYPYLNFEKSYGNAFISRPYINLEDRSACAHIFDKLKQIWDKKDVVIIEGKFSKLGVGNDLFANAHSLQRVLCPPSAAFDKYDEILSFAKTLPKDKLVLLALGMTATALAFDLALEGFWAIDIGHIDIEYEWYLSKATRPVVIPGKYTNEADPAQGGLTTAAEEMLPEENNIIKIIE